MGERTGVIGLISSINGLVADRAIEQVNVPVDATNTLRPSISDRANVQPRKTYMGSIAITAPDSWGFMSGSTWYAGVVNGFSSEKYGDTQTSWYLGGTLATPVTGLKLGASFDILDLHTHGETWSVAGYASYQATDKLSLHLRGEYLRDRGEQKFFGADFDGERT